MNSLQNLRTCEVCGTSDLPKPRARLCTKCSEARAAEGHQRWLRAKQIGTGKGNASRSREISELLKEGDCVTHQEIATCMGVTKARVQVVEQTAIAKVQWMLLQRHPEVLTTAIIEKTRAKFADKGLVIRSKINDGGAKMEVLRKLDSAQVRQLAGLHALAEDYARDGQREIAAEIRAEVDRLRSTLSSLYEPVPLPVRVASPNRRATRSSTASICAAGDRAEGARDHAELVDV